MSNKVAIGMADMPGRGKKWEDLIKTLNFLNKFKEDILAEYVGWDMQEVAEEIADFLDDRAEELQKEVGIPLLLKAYRESNKNDTFFVPAPMSEVLEFLEEQKN